MQIKVFDNGTISTPSGGPSTLAQLFVTMTARPVTIIEMVRELLSIPLKFLLLEHRLENKKGGQCPPYELY